MTAATVAAAIMPAWLKSHSQGEYVFDHSWADAYSRAGGRYYPKLQVSVRGRAQSAEVVPTPFVPHRYFRKSA